MKRIFSFLIPFIVGILLFWVVIKQVANWKELGSALSRFSLWQVLIVLLLNFLIIFLETRRWQEILRSQGAFLSFKSLFVPYLSCFSIIYLVPMAIFWADFFRSQNFEEKKSFSNDKRIASVFIDRILSSLSNLLPIAIGSFIFFLETGFLFKELNIIFLGSIFFFIFIFLFFLVFIFYSNIFERFNIFRIFIDNGQKDLGINVKKEVFSFFRRKKHIFLYRVLFFSFLRSLLSLIQTWVLIFFLGYSISLFPLLAVFGTSLASLETPISLDLGSHDLVTALIFEKLGMEKEAGVAFALIFRLVNLCTSTVGMFFFFKLSFQNWQKDFLRKVTRLISFQYHKKHKKREQE